MKLKSAKINLSDPETILLESLYTISSLSSFPFLLIRVPSQIRAIGIISGLTYSSDGTVIFEGISKNPIPIYKINTECELLAAILNDEFNVPITELSKSFPDETNEAQQILDEIQINNGNATQEQESRINALMFSMISKYFSLNPDLKDSFYYMIHYPRDSLAWIDRIDPIFSKCNLALR